MPNYVLVDADQLDADLATVAESIRSKGGTTAQLAFPDGFKAAVDAIIINSGVTVKRASGTFSAGSNGSATVNCGFKPDMVYFTTGGTEDGYLMTGCLAFEAAGRDSLNTTTWDKNDNMIDCFANRISTGVTFKMVTYDFDGDWAESSYRGSFSYVAIKYTE